MLRKIGLIFVGILCLVGAFALTSAVLARSAWRGHTLLARDSVYSAPRAPSPVVSTEDRYLDLMKKVLTRYSFGGNYQPFERPKKTLNQLPFFAIMAFNNMFQPLGVQMVSYKPFVPELREVGSDRPAQAETMIGLRRLDNIQFCML